jgi:hypothetical protein
VNNPKKYSQISESREQSATSRKTDRARMDVDDVTKALELSSLRDPFHIHRRHSLLASDDRGACGKVGSSKGIFSSVALSSSQASQFGTGSEGHASSSDKARSKFEGKAHNFTYISGAGRGPQSDSTAKLDRVIEVSDCDSRHESADGTKINSDSNNSSETTKSRVRFGAVNSQSNTGTADTPFCAFSEKY